MYKSTGALLSSFSKFNKENVDGITTEYYDLNESFKNIQEAIEYLYDFLRQVNRDYFNIQTNYHSGECK